MHIDSIEYLFVDTSQVDMEIDVELVDHPSPQLPTQGLMSW